MNTWRGARGGIYCRPRDVKLHIRVTCRQHRGKTGGLFLTPPLLTRLFETPIGANNFQGALAIDFLFQSPQSFVYRIAFFQFDFRQNTVTSSPETLETPAKRPTFLFVRPKRLFCPNLLSIGIRPQLKTETPVLSQVSLVGGEFARARHTAKQSPWELWTHLLVKEMFAAIAPDRDKVTGYCDWKTLNASWMKKMVRWLPPMGLRELGVHLVLVTPYRKATSSVRNTPERTKSVPCRTVAARRLAQAWRSPPLRPVIPRSSPSGPPASQIVATRRRQLAGSHYH